MVLSRQPTNSRTVIPQTKTVSSAKRRVSRRKKISVLLADDHAVVRRGLRTLLELGKCFKVAGQARNGREAVEMAHALRPDVILMDIAMPGLNGFQATQQILAANPGAKILILSVHTDDEYVQCMISVGAVGYLNKQTSSDVLIEAIHEIIKGHQFFSPTISKRMTRGGKPGSRRPWTAKI